MTMMTTTSTPTPAGSDSRLRSLHAAASTMLRLAALLAAGLAPVQADETIGREEVASLAYQGSRVRLYAVAAPRVDQICKEWRGGQPVDYACGQHARAFLQSLVAGRDPFCVREQAAGSASCYVDGRDIGLEMVAAGWAVARREESERYVYAQERAREQGRGLWRGQFDDPTLLPQPDRRRR